MNMYFAVAIGNSPTRTFPIKHSEGAAVAQVLFQRPVSEPRGSRSHAPVIRMERQHLVWICILKKYRLRKAADRLTHGPYPAPDGTREFKQNSWVLVLIEANDE